jgi:gas vesicle protein
VSEQDRSNDAVVSLLAGLGLGFLIGATTALLIAPHSGAETRSYIGDTATDVLGKVRDAMDDVREKLDEALLYTRRALGRPASSGDGETAEADAAPAPSAGV